MSKDGSTGVLMARGLRDGSSKVTKKKESDDGGGGRWLGGGCDG